MRNSDKNEKQFNWSELIKKNDSEHQKNNCPNPM